MTAEVNGLPGVPGGPGRRFVVLLVCGILPATLVATMVAVPAVLWSRLPARVASHWTITGAANGTMPRAAAFVLLGVLALLGAAPIWLGWTLARKWTPGNQAPAGAWRRPTPGTAAGFISLGIFLLATGAASASLVAVANLGGGGPRSASVGVGGLVGVVGGPAVLAACAGYLLRRYSGFGTGDDGTPRSSLGLRAGERAVWTGRARAKWRWPTGMLLLLVMGALGGALTSRWLIAAMLLIAAVSLLGFTSVRVTVSARGVVVGYGVLGLRLTRIPLRKIASAEAVEGGEFSFGYRGSLLMFGHAAVVLRRGPVLRLTLRDGKTFLVTVDDAATGAALLNDLIAAAD